MTDQTPGPGHNQPPAYEEIKARTDVLIDNANRWINERPEITDEDTAAKANDFLTQLRAEYKAAEEQRRKEKKPHEDAAKAVDAQYKPIADLLTRAADAIKSRLTAWLQKKQREADEARRQEEERARAEAERIRKEAEELAAKGKAIEAEVAHERAEAAARLAEAAEGAAPAKAQAKGEFGRAATLRTTYVPEITDHNKALAVYAHDPLIVEALQKCVARDVRAGKHVIPGVVVRQHQTAA